MSIRIVVAAGGIIIGTLVGCGPDEVTLPTPPMADETARLVALYDMPTAVLDGIKAQQALAIAQKRQAELHTDWLPDVIVDALARLRGRLEAGGLSADPALLPARDGTQQTVVAEVHRICAGWDSPATAPDQATNGAIDVTAISNAGQLNPEVWGTSSACRIRFPRAESGALAAPGAVVSSAVVRATLDGTLIVYLLGPVPSTTAEAQLLVSFNGMIAVSDEAPRPVAFDFEIVNGTIRFRISAGGGDAIVTVGATFGIQAANAGFSCDVASGSCQPT